MRVCHLKSSHPGVVLHLPVKFERELPVLHLAEDSFSEVARDSGQELLVVEARGAGELAPELRHLNGPADAKLHLVVRPVDEPVVAGDEEDVQEELPELRARAGTYVVAGSWKK